jgi:DNA-binding LytR/AlgR family response regulator
MDNHQLRCIVLEDEEDIRSWLVRKLATFPELEIVGEASSVDDAYRLIATQRPDVAFMDIHLIGGDAFSLLSRLQAGGLPIPYIVMATGHPDYAMQALNDYRHHIVQYLVKPFIENWQSKFRKAIDALMAAKLKALAEQERISPGPVESAKNDATFTFIQNKGTLLRLDFDQIVYLESAGGGESLVVMDEGYHQVSLSMNKLLELLPARFVRISKSNIVNVDRVASVNRGERSLEIRLKQKNVSLGLSDTYYGDFIARLSLGS